MKKSMQEKYAEALIAKGETEITPSPSGKYRCFTRANGGHYWLGRSGAVRIGRTSTGSIPMADHAKGRLLAGESAKQEKLVAGLTQAQHDAWIEEAYGAPPFNKSVE